MILFIISISLVISLLVFNAIVLVDIKILLNQIYNIRNTKSKQLANKTDNNDSYNVY